MVTARPSREKAGVVVANYVAWRGKQSFTIKEPCSRKPGKIISANDLQATYMMLVELKQRGASIA